MNYEHGLRSVLMDSRQALTDLVKVKLAIPDFSILSLMIFFLCIDTRCTKDHPD